MRLTTLLLVLFSTALSAQPDTVFFSPVSTYPYPAPFSAYTARFDRLHRHFLYTANKEYGLIVFDFSEPENLTPVRIIPVQDFQGLKPTDLVQQGQRLYVALGDFAGLFPQKAGLAVVDVADPAKATVLGQWSDASFNKGAAAVLADGDYAFLGAMDKGVLVLNISNPDAPAYVAHVLPDPNWPVPPGLFSTPHARGLALQANDLWVCDDAGGLRLVDVSVKEFPQESAKYLNAALDAAAQPAYNNAAIAGPYLFATVDYCGLDIVHIGDPAHPQTAAWINPWNCSNTNWDGRPGHTNQLVLAAHDSLLFVSGADSELLAYDITQPDQAKQSGQFGALQDSVASWGLDANDSLVVLAQLWSPSTSPYIAKKGGIRLLRWARAHTSAVASKSGTGVELRVWPNPAAERTFVRFILPASNTLQWSLTDARGWVWLQQSGDFGAGERQISLDLRPLPPGVYTFTLCSSHDTVCRKIIKN